MPTPEEIESVLAAHAAGEHTHRARARLVSLGCTYSEAQAILGGRVDTTQALYRDVEPITEREALAIFSTIARDPRERASDRIAAAKTAVAMLAPAEDSAAKSDGLSGETIERIKRSILGMPDALH